MGACRIQNERQSSVRLVVLFGSGSVCNGIHLAVSALACICALAYSRLSAWELIGFGKVWLPASCGSSFRYRARQWLDGSKSEGRSSSVRNGFPNRVGFRSRVAEVLLDEDLARALGSSGRQFVMQHLDARDSADRVMSIYDAVLNQRAASHQAQILRPAGGRTLDKARSAPAP